MEDTCHAAIKIMVLHFNNNTNVCLPVNNFSMNAMREEIQCFKWSPHKLVHSSFFYDAVCLVIDLELCSRFSMCIYFVSYTLYSKQYTHEFPSLQSINNFAQLSAYSIDYIEILGYDSIKT